MKKLFTLAVALIAMVGVTNAQDYDLYITKTNGDVTKFKVGNVKDITYVEHPDENEGWTSLGYCLYGEDFLASTLTVDGSYSDLCCEYYVEVQEKDDEPGLYRLVNPYSTDIYPFASSFPTSVFYDIETDYYIEINATDPDCVYIDYQDTGLTWSPYGRFYVWCSASRLHERNFTWDEIKEGGLYAGTLKDGIITFPKSMLLSQFPSYSTGFFTSNRNENFIVNTTDTSEIGGSKNVRSIDTKGGSINLNKLLTADEVADLKLLKKQE